MHGILSIGQLIQYALATYVLQNFEELNFESLEVKLAIIAINCLYKLIHEFKVVKSYQDNIVDVIYKEKDFNVK